MVTKQAGADIRFKLTTYKLLIFLGFLACLSLPGSLVAQPDTIENPIVNLHHGTLIVRIPTNRTKIDTLQSMIRRSKDENNKARLEKLLQQTMADRDTLFHDYIRALKGQYTFSKVAYFFDYDAHHLNTATYYNLDGEKLAVADLAEKPIFYLFFERTEESKIDALVIRDRELKIVPRPFPNNFSRGGINYLFQKLWEKNFAEWRIKKMNKALFKYYGNMRML